MIASSNRQLHHSEISFQRPSSLLSTTKSTTTTAPVHFSITTSPPDTTQFAPGPSYEYSYPTSQPATSFPLMYNDYNSTQAPSSVSQLPDTAYSTLLQTQGSGIASHDWQMYHGQNGGINGGISALQTSGLFGGNRGHQRNGSESTINSAGPSSPFLQNSAYPFIANTDRSPSSPRHLDDSSSSFQKSPAASTSTQTPFAEQYQRYSNSNVGYMPSQLSHTPAAHLAMKNLGIDHHHSTDDVPEFSHSSRQSVSSRGQDSPSTPQLGSSDEQEERPALFKAPSNGETSAAADLLDAYLYGTHLADYRAGAPRVELFRTESAACADELYNPENFSQHAAPASIPRPTPSSTNNNFLSPNRNLVNERIRTANSIRSQSPAQPPNRDRSPFRTGSPLAPAEGFKSPSAFLATAADSRRKQKEDAYARELGQHQPKLRRETTKTMSPKDALLDYTEADNEMPLFSDTIPAGYQRHYGGSESFMNNFISGTNQSMANVVASAQPNMAGFRASTGDGSNGTDFNFLPPSVPTHMQTNPYTAPQYRPTSFTTDQDPDFPAHLTSMESSMSDAGAPTSSQGSSKSAIQRPSDTHAHTNTYTCVAPGCAQRFESSAQLQRHKRDAHSSASARDSYSSAPATSPEGDDGSASPQSGDSLGSGMTSAALAARNSQQGPHKCARINPSTGKPCNTIFSRPYDLTRHEDTIHNRGKQKVRCQYCSEKSFSRPDALTRHMRVVHPEVDFQVKRGGRKGDAF
ncbi:hypothetical protein MBLNU459_g5753t1 [Dothideomycetes sp. NU459]